MVCIGFILGVLTRSFLFVDFYVTLFGILIAFGLFIIFKFILKSDPGILCAVFILCFSFGVWRFHSVDISPSLVFESMVNSRVSLSGRVVDAPVFGEKSNKLVVEVVEQGEKTNMLATSGFGSDFRYGDVIELKGTLKKPDNFITDQGKEFDYINYLRKDGIYYVMSYANLKLISSGNGNKIQSALFSIKEKFLEKINFAIPAPESLLMGGLILGEKAAFSEDLRTQFVNTGTIHIVALSGYNVTIVAEWFMKLFSFLPPSYATGVGIFSIFLFILMTGASSTAIRSGIMATLALFARSTGRNYDAGRALMIAAVIMILANPFVLAFDVSFQLSFIATVAVIFFTPRIEKYFFWVTKRFGLRDIFSVTFAAYIFVLPFVVYKMGNLSLVALPANILVLPFIPATMLFGFITGFIGLFGYFLSVPFGYLSYLLLHYELSVIGFLAHIPFSSVTIPNFPLIFTVIIYIFLLYKIFKPIKLLAGSSQ